MTVRTTVKIQGDADSAVGEVYRLRDALRSVGATANDFVGGATKITLGMLGAESAVAGARIAMNSLREGMRAYTEINVEAAEAMAALSARALEGRQALGEMVLGAGNAEAIAGALIKTMDDLSRAMGDNAGVQRIVRLGVAALIDGFGAAADVAAIASVGINTLRSAFIALSGNVEIAVGGVYTLGTALLEGLMYPVEAVARGVVGLVGLIDGLGQAIGGPVAQITGDVRRGVDGLDATVTAAREALSENRRAAAASVSASARAMDEELKRAGDQMQATFERLAQLGTDAHETADALREGTIAIDGQAAALRGQASAAKEASAARAMLTAEQIKAKAIAPADLAGAKEARALEAQKAADLAALAALDAQRAAAAEDAARRIADAMASEREAMERRAQVARDTGDAVARALAAGVSGQRDASRQIVAIIAEELRKRIVAAIATTTLLGATPGGQGLAAFLAAAVGTATAALTQIGGRGGGGGGGGGGSSAPQVNVSIAYSGQDQPSEGFISAVVDAVQRGTRRGMVGA